MAFAILSNIARSECLALVPKSNFAAALQVIQRPASSKAQATKANENDSVNLLKQDMEGKYSPFQVKIFILFMILLQVF